MEAPNSPPLSFDMFKALSADAARPLYDALQTTSEQNVRFVLSTTREHASRVREGAISQPSAGLVELAVRTRKSLEPLVQAAAELDDLLRELRGAERATGPRTPHGRGPKRADIRQALPSHEFRVGSGAHEHNHDFQSPSRGGRGATDRARRRWIARLALVARSRHLNPRGNRATLDILDCKPAGHHWPLSRPAVFLLFRLCVQVRVSWTTVF